MSDSQQPEEDDLDPEIIDHSERDLADEDSPVGIADAMGPTSHAESSQDAPEFDDGIDFDAPTEQREDETVESETDQEIIDIDWAQLWSEYGFWGVDGAGVTYIPEWKLEDAVKLSEQTTGESASIHISHAVEADELEPVRKEKEEGNILVGYRHPGDLDV